MILAILGVFLVATLDLGAWAGPAAADSARDRLTRAEDYFLVADFSSALEMVNDLLESGEISGDGLRDAHVLKARCELGLVHRSSAIDAFCSALQIDPQWNPDPDFYTKDELEVFAQARTTCSAGSRSGPVDDAGGTPPPPSPLPDRMSRGDDRPWYKKPLYLGIAGAAVVLVAVLALSGGDSDDSDPPLSDFPDPPAN